MKYVVKLTYTNPAHEHVTLRRRVDTVNRIVEAASEQEALNRAANQQRALGFKIQEAAIVEQEKKPVKTEQLTEASKEGSAVMRGMRATLKSMDLRHGVDSDKRDAGYKKSPAVAAAQAKSDKLSKVVKRPQAGTLAAVHKSMEREMQKESVEYIEEKLTAADPASKWIADFVKSDNPKFAGKSKKERINQALGAYYAAKRGKVEEGFDPSPAEIAKMLVKKHGAGNVTKQHILDLESDRDSFKGLDHDEVMKHVQKMDEEVELDEAQKKLKPSYWKAEWRLGTQSEVDKNNKKIFDKLAKTDPVKAAAFHDNLMRMKKKDVKEEVEQMTEDQASDMQKIQSMDKGSMTGGKAELKTHLKYLQAMHTHQKKHGLDTAKTKNKIEGVSRTLVQMGEEVEQINEGPSHLQYSGTVDGEEFTLTVPRHRDLGDHLDDKNAHSKVKRENPHLKSHHIDKIINDHEDVEIDQEPRHLYKEEVEQVDEARFVTKTELKARENEKKLKTTDAYKNHVARIKKVNHLKKMVDEIHDNMQADFWRPKGGNKSNPIDDATHKRLLTRINSLKEEIESVEESVATAQKVMDRAKVVANTNPDPKKRFAASGLAQKAMLRTINPTGVNTGIVRGGGNKTYRMVTGKVPSYQLTKKTGVSEEVEQVDEANTRVVNKEVKKEKAAETAVAAARRAKNSKNKVETEPRLDMDVGSSEKKYVTKV